MGCKYLFLTLVFILLFSGCNKEDKKVTQPPEGCINLSDLETRHDYNMPFALLNDSLNIRQAILNDSLIDFSDGDFIEFTDNGFYEMVLIYNDSRKGNDTFLFTTTTEERSFSEWGISAWVPVPFETVTLESEVIETFFPLNYTDSINVPFIFYVKESGSVKPVYCKGKGPGPGDSFNIKRGVGSVNIAASEFSGQVGFTVGGKKLSFSPAKKVLPDNELKGTINSATSIPSNSIIRISGNLNIESGGSLTVQEGVVILVDEAADINVSGPVIFSGTDKNPILVTCIKKNRYWGGFITRVSGGTIEAQYTIFCQSGYHDTGNYNWGHSGRQALFYTENSTLNLNHCFMLDHIGQIFYPQNSTLVLDDILVQRAQTGGQINNTDLTIRNSVFTDFPDDSYVFRDEDSDALYISASDAEIVNTAFMFAKDDGLDSGNSEGGNVTLENCRMEACFHEGAALSSAGDVVKSHIFRGCVFTNCGQGLELGFSSPNHSVLAENCIFSNNGIGIRYGDNYDWSQVDGRMFVKDSYSLNNEKDVWNMVRMIWAPKLENMSFENTFVSHRCPQYPDLNTGR